MSFLNMMHIFFVLNGSMYFFNVMCIRLFNFMFLNMMMNLFHMRLRNCFFFLVCFLLYMVSFLYNSVMNFLRWLVYFRRL